jgi:hypothetical protein
MCSFFLKHPMLFNVKYLVAFLNFQVHINKTCKMEKHFTVQYKKYRFRVIVFAQHTLDYNYETMHPKLRGAYKIR